jgi:hypothetical protein
MVQKLSFLMTTRIQRMVTKFPDLKLLVYHVWSNSKLLQKPDRIVSVPRVTRTKNRNYMAGCVKKITSNQLLITKLLVQAVTQENRAPSQCRFQQKENDSIVDKIPILSTQGE